MRELAPAPFPEDDLPPSPAIVCLVFDKLGDFGSDITGLRIKTVS